MSQELKIGVILGSSRDGRISPAIAKWVLGVASKNSKAKFELVDIKDYKLPLLGESTDQEPTKKWNETLKNLDGFIFVAAEYNHSISGSLKNAIDHAYENWFNKAAGIVSYGYGGGARAAEHLRGILGAIAIADVQTHVMINIATEYKDNQFTPFPFNEKNLTKMVEEVVSWSKALKTIKK